MHHGAKSMLHVAVSPEEATAPASCAIEKPAIGILVYLAHRHSCSCALYEDSGGISSTFQLALVTQSPSPGYTEIVESLSTGARSVPESFRSEISSGGVV